MTATSGLIILLKRRLQWGIKVGGKVGNDKERKGKGKMRRRSLNKERCFGGDWGMICMLYMCVYVLYICVYACIYL